MQILIFMEPSLFSISSFAIGSGNSEKSEFHPRIQLACLFDRDDHLVLKSYTW